MFVSQCNNIKSLYWETSQSLLSFPGASTCFSRLNYLHIDINFVDSNAMYEMGQICKDLNRLTIWNCYQDLPGLIFLIDVQRNLKSVAIYPNENDESKWTGTCRELSKVLAKKSNTMNHLCLGTVSMIPPSFLTSLINLKKISKPDF